MAITRTLRAISGAALAGALVFASSPTAAADDVRDKQWPLASWDAEAVWEVTQGAGQTVAVIDDGVGANHPDLQGSVLKGKDFIDGGSPAPPTHEQHGTGMASLIAGHGHGPDGASGVKGLAPQAKILPIRDHGGSSNELADSIRYAVDQGASVINISQGGGYSADEAEAITYALEKDVLVVAPTGNSGRSTVEYPAAYPGVLAVGGVAKDGSVWSKANYGSQTLISAPAANVLRAGSTKGPTGYSIADGTSSATAYVSAAAALVRAKYPDLAAGQVAKRLTETASLPASERDLKLPDEKYGYGSINPLAALTEDIPKGSKYGPLSVPDSLTRDTDTAEEIAAGQEQADKKALFLQITAGVVVLVFLAVVVLIIVLVRRKKKNNRGNGPGGPAGWAPPGQAPGYGQPPHQQQPGDAPYYSQQQPPRH